MLIDVIPYPLIMNTTIKHDNTNRMKPYTISDRRASFLQHIATVFHDSCPAMPIQSGVINHISIIIFNDEGTIPCNTNLAPVETTKITYAFWFPRCGTTCIKLNDLYSTVIR